jgi:hypothetical protein
MIIFRIFNQYSISTEYADEEGNLYDEVPAGATIIEKPYSQQEALDALRLVRNTKLVECDYTQLPDVGIDAAKLQEWRSYRQALRDITTGLEWNVTVWPDPPQ